MADLCMHNLPVPSPEAMPFEINGPGKSSPVVLVPGGLSGWTSWKPHAEILSKSHRVIRVQLITMAAAERNEKPQEGYSLRTETEGLAHLLERLGVQKIHLVGWSQGGEISLDFALNYPDRIQTLTLIEPAAYWVARAHGVFTEEEKKFRRFFHEIHDPPTEEDLIKFLTMNELVPPGHDPRSLPLWPVWNTLKIVLSSAHTVIEHNDDLKRLDRLKERSTLLVRGKDSTGFNAGIITLLSDALGSRAHVLELPDAHACHIVAKDQFLAALEEHVRQ